MSSSSFWMNNF